MIAVPAALPNNLSDQVRIRRSRGGRRQPRPSVAADRSWGSAMVRSRPAPSVCALPTQRTLVAAMQSQSSDPTLRRGRGAEKAPPSPRRRAVDRGAEAGESPPCAHGAAPQQRVEGGARASAAAMRQPRPELAMRALVALPGAGVVQAGAVHAADETPLLPAMDVHAAADDAVREVMETPRAASSQNARCSPTVRNTKLDLGGAQHPRSPTSAGVAEARRPTVRHVSDILFHPTRATPGLVPQSWAPPDERRSSTASPASGRYAEFLTMARAVTPRAASALRSAEPRLPHREPEVPAPAPTTHSQTYGGRGRRHIQKARAAGVVKEMPVPPSLQSGSLVRGPGGWAPQRNTSPAGGPSRGTSPGARGVLPAPLPPPTLPA